MAAHARVVYKPVSVVVAKNGEMVASQEGQICDAQRERACCATGAGRWGKQENQKTRLTDSCR